jgi:hypothetical protein
MAEMIGLDGTAIEWSLWKQAMDNDDHNLRLLSIFHYVLSGIMAVAGFVPFIHIAMGIAMVSGAFDQGPQPFPFPPEFGWVFIIFAAGFILIAWAMAVGIGIAGRRISQRRSYLFCLIMAGIECTFSPLGTVLGVFTILVLMKPRVKKMFGVAPTPAQALLAEDSPQRLD